MTLYKKKYMRAFTCLVLLSIWVNPALSQDKSIELINNPTSFGYDIYTLDSTGIFLVERIGQVRSNQLVKDVKFFNTDLELEKEFFISIDERYRVVNWVWDARGVFFLYQRIPFLNELAVMHVKPSGEFEVYQLPLVENMNVKHFHVFDNKAVVGGIFGWKPTFWLFEMDTKKITPLRGIYQKNTNLIQSLVDKTYNVVSVLTTQGELIGPADKKLSNFSLSGELERSIILEPKEGTNLVSGVITNFRNGYQYVIGSYTEGMNRGYTGVYAAKIAPDGSHEITYKPYFELEGMYSHYKEKKESNIVLKAKKKYEAKNRWLTSRRLDFYMPRMADDYIYVTAMSSLSSEHNMYQLRVDYDGNIEMVLNAPFLKRSRPRLLTKFENGIIHGKDFVYNNVSYFVSVRLGVLAGFVLDEESAKLYRRELVDFNQLNVVPNTERYLHYWYDNRLVTGRLEVKNKKRYFKLTSWTIGPSKHSQSKNSSGE